MDYPFLGGGYIPGGDAVRCKFEDETLVCRLTRKYHLFYGLVLTVLGPYFATVGAYKLYERWTARPEPAWTSLLPYLCVAVLGTAVCAQWVVQFFYDATICFDFGEGVVEFRRTGLFPCRWRFRLRGVSGVGVERRIVLRNRIELTEAEYARRSPNTPVQGEINRLMLIFADGGSIKAFETGRPDVVHFAARCIAEQLGLPSPTGARAKDEKRD